MFFWKKGSGVLESKEAASRGEGEVVFCLVWGRMSPEWRGLPESEVRYWTRRHVAELVIRPP